ncbi:MAG: Isoleucine-tRNA ligase [Parcubacteria group bacterium GW2011_GWB1_52_7]|nr:MAG: Isoleucine-tRNA ligase [Parcubacteria group bacterium GW2011_GWB1_52_7]
MGGAFSGEWKRVSEVFDCWFESGSMPYASNHYPFKKNSFNPKGFFGFNAKGYPADFIAEGLDQTRGWFYSLIVLGTALFGKSPYKQVIVNGLILAGDGQKMSKRLRNYPDPMEVVGKYGADALRYYLLSSPVIRGEDLRFQERGVDEVAKKLLMRLDNVRSFYDLYAPSKVAKEKVAGSHVLDRWILSRLAETVELSTKGFNIYELDAAARPVGDFIDDLSTWYVRRSRDRFKSEGEDKQNALATLRHTLKTIAQVMAPIMPFFAEDLYRRMRSDTDPVSVHLTDWPAAQEINAKLVADMARARAVSSLGLQAREKAGIKIRQPLQTLTAKALPDDAALRAIIADEVNVKEVVEDAALSEEVTLDTTLTSALKEEGALREWVRAIQDWRKTSKLSVADRPGLLIKTPDAEFIRRHREALMEATGLLSLETKEGDSLEFERL